LFDGQEHGREWWREGVPLRALRVMSWLLVMVTWLVHNLCRLPEMVWVEGNIYRNMLYGFVRFTAADFFLCKEGRARRDATRLI
jgi:hypothetical protein